ncbi:MAG: DUF5664 domain-containing protein [Candidatus Cloacimonetes bacterium]|nr:DUF5664 domain-containing protein [Candidatus Cloacimonadota bacterium]
MIKDSGERRQFGTGAVRDIQEGKGRCDLMPLLEVAGLTEDRVLQYIGFFQRSGGIIHLNKALEMFAIQKKVDLITMMIETSKHFEDGAKKYGENNWQKGIPVHCYIDSAVRHLLKDNRGDTDEPHDRAFVWNILCCMWTINNKPEIIDMKGYGDEDESN